MAKRRPPAVIDRGLPDKSLFFEDLTGGVDLIRSPSTLEPDRSQELLNFSLEEPGALTTVDGYALFTDTALSTGGGGNVIQGAERVYLDTTPVTMVAFEGGLYQVSDAGVFGSVLDTTRSASNQIYFPHNKSVVLVLDGANQPLISSDNTNFYKAGITAPAGAPTLGTSAGGSLLDSNTYEVTFTYVTSSAFDTELVHESNASPAATQAVSGANLTITVQGASSSDAKVDKVYVYARNTTTGQSLGRKVAEVANGGTWSTSFNTEPSELAATPPTTHDEPESFSYGVFFRNRWWTLHPTVKNRLHFSEVFEPQTWPADYYIDFPLVRGDELTTLVPLGDLLIIFGNTGVYILSGDTILDIDVRPALSYETGAFGPRAALRTEAGIVHSGVGGVFLFNGANDQNLGQDIERGWRDMTQNVAPAQLKLVAMAYRSSEKEVLVSVPRLYPTGAAGEYVLDLIRSRQVEHPAWARTDRSIRGYIPWSGNEPNSGNYGRLFSWPSTLGKLYEERTGTTLDGSDLTAVYKSPAHTTQFRETMLVHGFVEFLPSSGALTVELFVNGDIVSTQTINVAADVSVYGTAEYGISFYGGPGRRRVPLMFPLPADGTEFTFQFTYVGQNQFKLFSYGFGSVPEPVIRTL